MYQQGHVTTHLTGHFGTGIPGRTRNTVETGTVLHGFGKLKPVPVPVHTRDTLSRVYPYPCHALATPSTTVYEETSIRYNNNDITEGSLSNDAGIHSNILSLQTHQTLNALSVTNIPKTWKFNVDFA